MVAYKSFHDIFFDLLVKARGLKKKKINTKYFILRRKRREWLPNLSSQRLMFKRSTNSRSNWNLEMLVFEEGGKPEYPKKNPRSKDEN